MSYNRTNNFIEKNSVMRKIMSVFAIIVVAMCGSSDNSIGNKSTITMCSVFLFFFLADGILKYFQYFDKEMVYLLFRLTELIAYSVIEGAMHGNIFIVVVCIIFNIMISIEYILYDFDYDASVVFARRFVILAPMIVTLLGVAKGSDEYLWFTFALVDIMIFAFINWVVEAFIKKNNSYEKSMSDLRIEKSQLEDSNAQLIEYQEKVKAINEQINYQKIDLGRANKELEQINLEMESQTEIMKYMASTFDVLKCVNVITDAVMEVKKPKLCAMYIDETLYKGASGTCIIKTNYTSMQRRLKKEIDKIFTELCKKQFETKIYTEDLKRFKFIGDANIGILAIIPFVNGKSVYGMMMIGSDNVKFFDKGMNYYENCIAEFNVAVNSTKLYLKMQDMARKDGLTGIYNRIYFKELFVRAIKDCKRRNKPISVTLYDIDKFKKVNDTYGHIAGDKVIQMVANVGKKYAEANGGFACRYGGEEFILVFPDIDEEKVMGIMEELHQEIKTTSVIYDNITIPVDVCIGITSYPNICDDVDLLISRADKAMYYGKNHGRGRLVLDNPDIEYDE